MDDGAVRDGDRRRRPGRPGGRVPPARRGPPVRDPRRATRVGDAWRHRWDSLRLFTPGPLRRPARDALPRAAVVVPHQGRDGRLPRGLRRRGSTAGAHRRPGGPASARETGSSSAAGDRGSRPTTWSWRPARTRAPRMPAFAAQLDPGIVQLHSSDYRRPLAAPGRRRPRRRAPATRAPTSRSKRRAEPPRAGSRDETPATIPFRIDGTVARPAVPRSFRFLLHARPDGEHADRPQGPRPGSLGHGLPLVRVKPKDLAAAGVERVPRTAGVRDGLPVLEDGRVLDVANVIWCTGFRPDFSWIDLPVFDDDGAPCTTAGW